MNQNELINIGDIIHQIGLFLDKKYVIKNDEHRALL